METIATLVRPHPCHLPAVGRALWPRCFLRVDGHGTRHPVNKIGADPMLKPGDKFKADRERNRYTVMAADERFAIMTKPFAPKKTYIYTITDLERGVRGPCDLIFGPLSELDTPTGAAEALAMLQKGEMSVSRRRDLSLTDAERSQLTGK